MRHHPRLEGARAGVQAAAGRLQAARGGFDPRFRLRTVWTPVSFYENLILDTVLEQPTPLWGATFFAGYRLGAGEFPIYKRELLTNEGGEVRAGVSVPLWQGGPIDPTRAAIRQARAGTAAAASSVDAAVLEVQAEAARTYWTWVAAGLQLAIAREQVSLAEDRRRGLRRRVEEGAIPRIELVDNERVIAEREAAAAGAEGTFEAAGQALAFYVRPQGQPTVPTVVQLPPAIPRAEWVPNERELERTIRQAWALRPDVEVLDRRVEAAQVEIELARNVRAPAIDADAFVAKDMGPGLESLRPVEFGVGLTVEIPLLLRTGRGRLQEARAEVARLRTEQQIQRERIAIELRQAAAVLEAARERAVLAERQAELAEQVAAGERRLLDQGLSNLLSVNLREQAAAAARSLAVEALADYQRALVDYLVRSGRSLL